VQATVRGAIIGLFRVYTKNRNKSCSYQRVWLKLSRDGAMLDDFINACLFFTGIMVAGFVCGWVTGTLGT